MTLTGRWTLYPILLKSHNSLSDTLTTLSLPRKCGRIRFYHRHHHICQKNVNEHSLCDPGIVTFQHICLVLASRCTPGRGAFVVLYLPHCLACSRHVDISSSHSSTLLAFHSAGRHLNCYICHSAGDVLGVWTFQVLTHPLFSLCHRNTHTLSSHFCRTSHTTTGIHPYVSEIEF